MIPNPEREQGVRGSPPSPPHSGRALTGAGRIRSCPGLGLGQGRRARGASGRIQTPSPALGAPAQAPVPWGCRRRGKGLPRQPPALPRALELPPHFLHALLGRPWGWGLFPPREIIYGWGAAPGAAGCSCAWHGVGAGKTLPGTPPAPLPAPSPAPGPAHPEQRGGMARKAPDSAGSQTKPSSQPSRAARAWAGAKRLSRCCAAEGL